jgi:hypothetical protein
MSRYETGFEPFIAQLVREIRNPNVPMTKTKAANDIMQATILFGSLEF